jgi:DNA-directed RNA polymerase sigma subunit (sigma70/sigma32)
VGQRFGVTRERVRQIESKALVRMRKLLEDDGPGSSLEN